MHDHDNPAGSTPNLTSFWMGELDDSVRLDEIMMPGSHDAGMSVAKHCTIISPESLTLTQGLSVGEQLLSGARYFDIRVDYDHDELVTYHRTLGAGCNGQTLRAVLDQTVAFLRRDGTEAVILKVSHIRGNSGDTKERISKLLDEYAVAMYCERDDPHVNLAATHLKKVRGKMILVFDYDEHINPVTGRFRYRDGVSETQCKNREVSTAIRSDGNLTVYDCYSNTMNFEEMKADQLRKWQACARMGAGRFFLLSWTLTGLMPIELMARAANASLSKVLRQQIESGWEKPNVVYMDFVSCPQSMEIIRYNKTREYARVSLGWLTVQGAHVYKVANVIPEDYEKRAIHKMKSDRLFGSGGVDFRGASPAGTEPDSNWAYAIDTYDVILRNTTANYKNVVIGMPANPGDKLGWPAYYEGGSRYYGKASHRLEPGSEVRTTVQRQGKVNSDLEENDTCRVRIHTPLQPTASTEPWLTNIREVLFYSGHGGFGPTWMDYGAILMTKPTCDVREYEDVFKDSLWWSTVRQMSNTGPDLQDDFDVDFRIVSCVITKVSRRRTHTGYDSPNDGALVESRTVLEITIRKKQ